jgi:hypothetical protein
MPISFAVLITLQAISPLLAMRILSKRLSFGLNGSVRNAERYRLETEIGL